MSRFRFTLLAIAFLSTYGCGLVRGSREVAVCSPCMSDYPLYSAPATETYAPMPGLIAPEQAPMTEPMPAPAPPSEVDELPPPPPVELDVTSSPAPVLRKPVLVPIRETAGRWKEKIVRSTSFSGNHTTN